MLNTVVGIVVGLIFLLGCVIAAAILMRRWNGRSISRTLQFHSGPFNFPWRSNWSSVPTHIVTQTNPTNEGVKASLNSLICKIKIPIPFAIP